MVVSWKQLKEPLKRFQSSRYESKRIHLSYKLVKRPNSPRVRVPQWLENPTGTKGVVASIPIWAFKMFSVVPSPVAKQPSFTTSNKVCAKDSKKKSLLQP